MEFLIRFFNKYFTIELMGDAITLQSSHQQELLVRPLSLLIPAVGADTTMSDATTYYIVSAFITLYSQRKQQPLQLQASRRSAGASTVVCLLAKRGDPTPTLRISNCPAGKRYRQQFNRFEVSVYADQSQSGNLIAGYTGFFDVCFEFLTIYKSIFCFFNYFS